MEHILPIALRIMTNEIECSSSAVFLQTSLGIRAHNAINMLSLELQLVGMMPSTPVSATLSIDRSIYSRATATRSLQTAWTGWATVDQWIGTWLTLQLLYCSRGTGSTAFPSWGHFSLSCLYYPWVFLWWDGPFSSPCFHFRCSFLDGFLWVHTLSKTFWNAKILCLLTIDVSFLLCQDYTEETSTCTPLALGAIQMLKYEISYHHQHFGKISFSNPGLLTLYM